ncbi:MAG: filamentous hemagglutinin N-terminal domain-containing protein [Rubrivivax sp.]|nr:filamentous hemagglutinin N-terminal domain-containing protein [Rubrivivax sp.]
MKCPRQRITAPRPSCARRSPHLTLLTAALLSSGLLAGVASVPALAAPQGGTVRAGSATIAVNGAQTRVDQASERAVIDWRGFNVGTGEQVLFVQPGATSAVLNRVTGEQLSVILGRIDANGQVFLVNPNGVVLGQGAQVNVGGFVASTANIGTADFMAGRLRFGEPGRPGAGIVNGGSITAAEGGLVALVAPHVRNDGVIQARLGRVRLGAGETFTLDLYGDGLLSLAVDPAQAAALHQAGRIEADGGQVVLVSAAAARSALDQVVNLTGSVRADTVAQQGGRIVLLASGGTAEVSGSLSAQGGAGQAGGRIEVLGERVHLGSSAALDASGGAGGGTIHVGGAWQGSGSGPRASATTVDAGATISADARSRGAGGEVVLWSDGTTRYAGSISARGGASGGDGGRVEVSGRGTLEFAGAVDAGAPNGAAGLLLLDPAFMNIGLAEASLISRVLRTGTSTAVSAEVDITVSSPIDGRGRLSGGGLTLTAGRDIHVNEFIVTADGAVRLDAATGTVTIAAGRGIFTGTAPITVNVGGDLSTGTMVTRGALSLTSSGGSIDLDTALDATIGAVTVNAAQDVRINQPVVNLRNGSAFTAVAGGDIVVGAQIDGRGATGASGAVELTAGNRVRFDESVVTQVADIRARAIAGAIETAAGRGIFSIGSAGANGGTIELRSGADFTTGLVSTSGPLNLVSTGGAVTVGQGIDASVGAVTISAATDANLDADIVNLRSGAPLTVAAGRDIRVNAQIDGRNGTAPGGTATLVAGRNVSLTDSITTHEGAIAVTATAGTVTQAPGVQLRTGGAPIAVNAGADFTTASYVTTGALSLASTNGTLTIAQPIYDSTGTTSLSAGTDILVQALVENIRTGAPLTMTAGRDIVVDAQIGQDRTATTVTGPIAMTAGRNVSINQDVVTRDAPLAITASTGTVTVAPQTPGPNGPQPQVRSGSGPITVSAGADLFIGNPAAARPNDETPYVTTGALNLSSTAGTLFIEAPIPQSTGTVTLNGGNAVRVNERIYSNNGDITITAGPGGISTSTATLTYDDFGTLRSFPLADIDARLGNLTLTAQGDIEVAGVRTAGTLTLTSTAGRIVGARTLDSRGDAGQPLGQPQAVRLAGALGIAGFVPLGGLLDIEARSSQGSVTATGWAAQNTYIEAALDILGGGNLGARMQLVAGRDVSVGLGTGLAHVTAGRDITFTGASLGALHAQAGQDILVAPGTLRIEGTGGTLALRDAAHAGSEVALGGLSLEAGRDITISSTVRVSDPIIPGGIGEATLRPTTMTAGRHLTIGLLETIGDVALHAATGNVTVTAPLGAPMPPIVPGTDRWNPAGVGVSSLLVEAPGMGALIDLQGARSQNDVALIAPQGTVNSAFAVTAIPGPPTIVAAAQNISATAIPERARPLATDTAASVITPGPPPLRGAPDGPAIAAAPAPGAPGLADIFVSAPEAIDAGAPAGPGSLQLAAGETTAEQAALVPKAGSSAEGADAPSETDSAVAGGRGIVLYSGGRGVAQSADLGRSGSYGSTRAKPDESEDEARRRPRGATTSAASAKAAAAAAPAAAARAPG